LSNKDLSAFTVLFRDSDSVWIRGQTKPRRWQDSSWVKATSQIRLPL